MCPVGQDGKKENILRGLSWLLGESITVHLLLLRPPWTVLYGALLDNMKQCHLPGSRISGTRQPRDQECRAVWLVLGLIECVPLAKLLKAFCTSACQSVKYRLLTGLGGLYYNILKELVPDA